MVLHCLGQVSQQGCDQQVTLLHAPSDAGLASETSKVPEQERERLVQLGRGKLSEPAKPKTRQDPSGRRRPFRLSARAKPPTYAFDVAQRLELTGLMARHPLHSQSRLSQTSCCPQA